MPKLIARWNPARDAWETETTGLFCEHSDVFLETWPTSGMTRGGTAYVLSTSVPRTDGSVSSSLLQTPSVADVTGGHRTRGGDRSDELLLVGQLTSLLPTPTTQDGANNGGPSQHHRNTPPLNAVVGLLPTPSASVPNDGEGTETWLARRERVKLTADNGNGMGMPLSIAVQLLPTPKTGPNRASRRAMTGIQHWSAPSLEQAVEIAQGILPREFKSWDEIPGSSGGSTSPRSADGNTPSDD